MSAVLSLPAPQTLAAFCRDHGVRKLRLFGSAVRDDFDPGKSDIDLLVEYLPGKHAGLAHFALAEELSMIFGRKVDLNTPAMLGRYLQKAEKEARTLYPL
jgi:predicted nucleotidyltransferase